MSHLLSHNSTTIIKKRYLDGPDETIDGMWDRVSGGNREFRRLMSELLFLPNSPTLFNRGTKSGGTSSACFVFDIEDCLLGDWPEGGLNSPFPNSIMGTTFKAACVAKAGGGVGYYLGDIREEGADVRSTHKRACGPVGVLHWLQRLRSLITQGGKRDLAQMAVLPRRHKDIRKFIHCKDEDPKALESFNISVDWDDEGMDSIDWDRANLMLSDPVLAAAAFGNDPTNLWMEQAVSAWRTGDPGMFFGDEVNRWNATPHLGRINAPNPCGETPNLNNEPCNLGSMVLRRLMKLIRKGLWTIDWDTLKEVVRQSIRFLDDILDHNKFPHPDITHMAFTTRKLGLGVMGWADALAMMHVPYDSQEAVDTADELMKTIKTVALEESIALGHAKGFYPAYDPLRSPEWALPCRNSTRTSIAPTGTISIIAECEPSIEPHFALERTRTTHEGIKFTEKIDQWLGDLGGFVPKVANDIPLEWHVKHMAAFQKHTDLGVSKTINLPNSATIHDVSRAYKLMWESKCKGGTVYRDGCRSEQVLVAKKTSVYTTDAAPVAAAPLKPITLPNDVPQLPRHKFKIGGAKFYLHVGVTADGTRPVEIFLKGSKSGSTLRGMLDAWAMSVSNALQHHQPLEEIVRLHEGSRFEPAGMTGNPDIPVCSSVPDYVVRFLALKFLTPAAAGGEPKHDRPSGESGLYCPECGNALLLRGGCLTCVKDQCGFSRCG